MARAAARGAGSGARRGRAISTRRQASQLLVDPWGARDAYGEVVDASPGERDQLLAAFARPELAVGGQAARDRARLLMELQRATLLMYASCAWFFDDVAGLEASLVHAARPRTRSICWGRRAAIRRCEGVLERLGEAKSNVREEGTGADVFRRVTGDRFTARHAVAFAGAAGLIGPAWVAPSPSGYAVEIRDERGGRGPAGMTSSGHARATSRRTGLAEELVFSALERAGSGLEIDVRVGGETLTLADLGRDHRERLIWAAIRKRLASGAPERAGVVAPGRRDREGGAGDGRGVGGRWQRIRRGRRRRARATTSPGRSCWSGCSSASGGRCRATRSRSRRSCSMRRSCLRMISLRRRLEEMVWDQLDAGADPRTVAPLTERLGFSEEAIGGEVIAS